MAFPFGRKARRPSRSGQKLRADVAIKTEAEQPRRLADGSGVLVAAAWTIVATGVVAILHVGADLLIPIALAVLLSFVLSPMLSLARKLRIARAPAVLISVVFAFSIILGLAAILAGQVGQLAGDLPQYQSTMRDKIQSMRGWTFGSGTLERAADMLQSLGEEFDAPHESAVVSGEAPAPGARPKDAPPLVEIRTPPPTAMQNLRDITAPMLHPMATFGIIVVFVIFMLMQKEDLRNRFMSLAGARDIQRTTAAIDEAARRLSRFFLMQLVLNAGFGVAIGLGLWAIGVPSPALWGIVAGVLRFVPYIGAAIAAVFPIVLAAAVDPGWTMLIATAALFLVIEPIVGHVIEPLVYGRSAGLSPFAVVVAATFWTALWGPIGLVLATPLTVCLVVLGRHVESLGFLVTLFGDRPALTPPELFYQRMLANDPGEAAEKAQEFLREKPLSAYYEDVALPGLLLAQHDAERGALDGDRLAVIKASVATLVQALDGWNDDDPKADETDDPEAVAALETVDPQTDAEAAELSEKKSEGAGVAVRCLGVRTPIEAAAALIVAQVLRKNGMEPQIEDEEFLLTSAVVEMEAAGPSLVCAVSLDAEEAPLRLVIRRLRRRLPHAHLIAANWSSTDREIVRAEFSGAIRADAAAFSLRDLVVACLESRDRLKTPANAGDGRRAEAASA